MENHINRHVAVQLHSWRVYQVPKWGYTVPEEALDPEKTVKASGREVRVSHKSAREVCRAIRGMMLIQAKKFLREVIAKKKAVPFTRFKKKAGHRHGLERAYAGRYPVKASKQILKILEGAEANAENKGLDTERLQIIHAAAYPGMKIKRYMPRAFGRATPKFETLCHIEVVLEEKSEKTGEA
ncbi:MAG: 50S ribosomal protein L22 [Candidatus Bathyarchaeota archaeon]|nr:50S ribosomal protein L22 [Candidatus Bathyarchaeota archaeon]